MYRKSRLAPLLAEDLCMRCANVAKHYEPPRNYLETNDNGHRDAAPECLEVILDSWLDPTDCLDLLATFHP